MADRKLYRVAPGAPQWLTEDEMIDRIKRWAANAPEYGAPSITVSTLVVPDTEPTVAVALEICGCGHTEIAHSSDGCLADVIRVGFPALCGCKVRPPS